MNIITQTFIKNIDKVLKIHSGEITSAITRYLDRSLRSNNYRKTSLSDLFSIINSSLQDTITKCVVKSLEIIDENYFNSKERKQLYAPKGKYSRTIITLFGEITFTRRAYVDKFTKKNHFYYLDSLLNISPRLILDNDVISELLFLVGENTSYAKAGQILGSYIFKNCSNDDRTKYISRATVFNYVKNTDIREFFYLRHKKVKTVFIELDEHFVSIQRPKGSPYPVKKKMVKAAKIYSSVNNGSYEDRYIMFDNFSSSSEFQNRLYEYVSRTYDLDYVENIFILGDGASWIKACQFIFDSRKTHYLLDKFHAFQALQHITTTIYKNEFNFAKRLILDNERGLFIKWLDDFKMANLDRLETIESKGRYILNNWTPLQKMFNFNGSCAMESCISHSLATIFTSRPKGFSLEILSKRLQLRSMVLNSFGNKTAFSKLLTCDYTSEILDNLDFSIFDYFHKSDTYPIHLNYKYL